MIETKELTILYATKDYEALRKNFNELQKLKENIDKWFTAFNNSYSNSVLSKASYESPIRKPYNEKFDEYERLMKSFRLCNYYLEELSC